VKVALPPETTVTAVGWLVIEGAVTVGAGAEEDPPPPQATKEIALSPAAI
jgi:hypothetical protein